MRRLQLYDRGESDDDGTTLDGAGITPAIRFRYFTRDPGVLSEMAYAGTTQDLDLQPFDTYGRSHSARAKRVAAPAARHGEP